MFPLSIADISRLINGRLAGNGENTVYSVLTDSRLYNRPAGQLFFALQGTGNDGHKYMDGLAKKGVKCFVVNRLPDVLPDDCSYVIVENVLAALQQLAAYKRSLLKGKVIAVTGSNGKTVVKEWLFQLLNRNFNVYRSPRSYNSQLGVALSLIDADIDADYSIIEAGISKPGEMEKLREMIQPDVAVLTNVGAPHQENFTSLDQKAGEKQKLFEGVKTVVLPHKWYNLHITSENCVTWSGHSESLFRFKTKVTKDATTIFFDKEDERYVVEIPFIDKGSVENAVTCFSVLYALGLDVNSYLPAFGQLEPVAMRLELKEGINNTIIIDDAYNSDLGSLAIALDYLHQQAQNRNFRKIVILSDIEQSGKAAKILYGEVNRLLNDKGVDRLIGIGKEISAQKECFTLTTQFFATTDAFLKDETYKTFSDEAILLKGARTFAFEHITAKLSRKVHKTVLEINLNALVHNVNSYRALLRPETKVMAMVKAFAYGSGAFEIARHLQHYGIDYLAVAVADEGVELRKAGVTCPIVVMAPELQAFDALVEYNLEPEIYSFGLLRFFIDELNSRGISQFPVHLKLDTGMHRLGFLPNEITTLIQLLSNQKAVKITSVFSHLAAADEPGKDEFTLEQLHLFDQLSNCIANAFPHKILRHILNSAGTERFTDFQFDMVRLGIGMYGVSVSERMMLMPVSTFKTTIVQIKKIPSTETVGYGRRGVLLRDSEIAVLPVGYADGLLRKVGNGRGYAMLNGQKSPYIGNICMDLCMIDVSGLGATEGDEVVLFGSEPTINDVAQWLDTIPYEVITGISRRVKRVFTRE